MDNLLKQNLWPNATAGSYKKEINNGNRKIVHSEKKKYYPKVIESLKNSY